MHRMPNPPLRCGFATGDGGRYISWSMSVLTDEQKKYRDRANRARRELFKEKEKFGAISDGSGKRYRVCVYFVLSGAPEKAAEFLEWFEQEFADDVGEPAFLLYAALAHYRVGSLRKARRYLLNSMLSNIYLLPYLFSRSMPKQDMWHSSNWAQPDYIKEIGELLEEPTSQEREWFKGQFEDELFTNVRNKYIETFRALQHADDFSTRSSILSEWREYVSSCRANEI